MDANKLEAGLMNPGPTRYAADQLRKQRGSRGLLRAVGEPMSYSPNPLIAALGGAALGAQYLTGEADPTEGAKSLSDMTAMAVGSRLPAPLRNIITYHGSPHKFDKFDSSKIGTGEGAQAYGHGLYLAESPDVANAYQYNLGYKAGNIPKIGGQDIGDYYNAVADRANRLPPNLAAKEYDKLAMLEDLMGEQSTPAAVLANVEKRQYPKHAVDWFKKTVAPKYESPGNLYKVDLPDSAVAKMLDWDKPLSQQPKAVQKYVKDLGYSSQTLKNRFGSDSGKAIHDLAKYREDGQVDASGLLKSAGIPGIRYLDGGSRGTGQGTSNFVVFPGEEGLLKILERNGNPLVDALTR